MAQYIDKDALVAKIESKKKYAQTLGDNAINNSMQQFYDGMKQGCVDILSTIDTLEVKEVDLEKEIEEYLSTYWSNEKELHPFLGHMAKHFFELGLKAKGEIYVVTRSEEHSDYVEAVFLNENKAEEYCNPFNKDEDCYARHITKVKIQ